MQKFDYRTPRFTVDFPVRIKMLNSLYLARCRDISEAGMRVELDDPFPPDCSGEVSFCYQELSFELPVRVMHTGTTSHGLAFVYQSEEQRQAILHLISHLATQRPSASLFLVDRELR